MKNYKRTLAALTAGFLALSPCFAAGMTAVAANTITINNAENDADNAHNYNAYCLIKATEIDDNGLLKGIELGDNVTSLSALANALKNMKIDEAPVGEFANLNGDSSLQDIVEALEAFNENREDKDVQQLAKALSEVKTGNPKPIPQDATSKNYIATVDDIGWYLITDTKGTGTKVVSANLLQVLGTAEVNPKFSLPSIDKKIVENENKVEFNEASIGDTINYELTSAVPNMQGYDKYFFVINDTIANSLTFNPESVHVYIDDIELLNTDDKKYFTVDTENTTVGDVKYSFQIVMNNFIQHADKAGKPIKVTYSAVLNEKANITSAGNVNDVCLTYSNNPNVTPNGESNENPDEPKQPDNPPGTPNNPDDDYDAPVGVTPKDRVKTFTTAIKIHKIDNKNNSLIGAEFTLAGNAANIVLVSTETFTADADGTYWKLKDGKYTTTNPNTDGIDTSKYESTDTKYKKSTELTPKGNVSTPVDIKGYVDNDGYISFIGLGAGTYTLTESKVPNGYNGIEPIEFTISNGSNMSFADPDWSISNNDFTHDGEYFNIEIKNVKGATLPSTGGIGTKLFYLFGGMLVVGSSVVLITKKRMSADEN